MADPTLEVRGEKLAANTDADDIDLYSLNHTAKASLYSPSIYHVRPD
jgi:hypothetical protein